MMVFRLRVLDLVWLAVRFGAAALLLAGAPAGAACTDVAAPKVDWRRCTLDAGDYANRKLNGAELRDASFNLANLAGVDLTEGDAYHAKFLSA
jgi:uncharacterized protein YjbI with pentapeptide repeats